MAFYQTVRHLSGRFRLILSSFMQSEGLAFADALPEETIQQAFDAEGAIFAQDEDAIYTPPLTLWAFLSQVLFKAEERSCTAAVARVVVLLVALGKKPPSADTGTYCRARAKLGEQVIARLTREVAESCEHAVPRRWLWHGRHVKLVDGTTVSMPDTQANQDVYPQHPGQKEGLGFPIARLVVLLSLATAMISDMALGPYQGKETGETALFRQLLRCLRRGDIVLADRYYCSYFTVCLLTEFGVDLVVRLHQRRRADFRHGNRLGRGDHVVTWIRPARPDWMEMAVYERMPETIEVREVQVQVHEPGFRVESLVVVTTLVDAHKYTRDDLAELYHKRWLAELDIRAIKCTLGMDVLRCKTPEMVRREMWTCLLAYNLIRKTMMESAHREGLSPRQLSFTAAMHKIAAGYHTIVILDDTTAGELIDHQLAHLAGQQVANRPHRVEPRATKRRPKPYDSLTKPRDEARAELLAGKS